MIQNADEEGTFALYRTVSRAVGNVRASAPLGEDWSEEIDADYRRREKRRKK